MSVINEGIDEFCDMPVQRPPVKDHGQVITVDGSLTGSE